jgi:phosphatidylglycerophosphate synthase
VRAVEIVDVPWFRAPKDRDAAQSRVSAVSRERVQGLLANRVDDGFYSTFVVRRASKPLTRLALRVGASPNTITAMSLLIGLAAAALFATGQWIWIALGAIALQVSLIVDCVDGEVARATRRFTLLGAWLDAATDRVKEFAAYGGLAIGASRMGVDVWWIAITLVVLQTTRHVSDYDFARIQRLREAQVPAVDIRERSDGRMSASGSLASAMQASARINRRSAVRWTKKVIHMPIGERWLLLSVLAIVAGPAWALGGLLIAGVVAFAYVAAGRIARTVTWSGSTPGDGAQVLSDQLDNGPLVSGIARVIPSLRVSLSARFAWSVPVLLRAVELTAIALLVATGGAANLAIAFWILFAIAYHHYDNLYRSLQGARPPRWLTWLGFGWDGRILVISVLAVTALCEPSLAIVLGWWVLWFAGVASIQWLRSDR